MDGWLIGSNEWTTDQCQNTCVSLRRARAARPPVTGCTMLQPKDSVIAKCPGKRRIMQIVWLVFVLCACGQRHNPPITGTGLCMRVPMIPRSLPHLCKFGHSWQSITHLGTGGRRSPTLSRAIRLCQSSAVTLLPLVRPRALCLPTSSICTDACPVCSTDRPYITCNSRA
jgi:hypothetical protein